MALIKSIMTDYGVPAEYWNIGAVQEDFQGQSTEVTFYGYASKEARDAGKQPLSAGKVQIAGNEYIAGADRATLYATIKQKPEFEGAEDV
jgi:rubrerythrin